MRRSHEGIKAGEGHGRTCALKVYPGSGGEVGLEEGQSWAGRPERKHMRSGRGGRRDNSLHRAGELDLNEIIGESVNEPWIAVASISSFC